MRRKIEEIDLYVTERCNLKCDFCSVQANTREIKELSLEKIFEIIDSAIEYGLEQLHFTGGEPTLRLDLEEIVEYAVSKKLNVRLITNGTILSEERLYALYQRGLKNIMVSLDGLEKYHDKVRGNGNYKKAINIIKYAISLKDMVVRVNSVAWRDNTSDILQLTMLLNEMGVDIYSIFLGSPLGFGKEMKDNVLGEKEYGIFAIEEETLVKESDIKMIVSMEKGYINTARDSFDRANLRGRGCGCYKINEGTDYFLIRGDGDVYPCVFFANEGEKIGNVMYSSFREIVEEFQNNPFYCEVGKMPEECGDCQNVDICKGGCRGYAKIYTGNWMEKDPRCLGIDDICFPVCPIMKKNLNSSMIGGSSEQVINSGAICTSCIKF